MREPVGEDRTEDRRPQRSADRAKEGRGGGRDPQLRIGNRVLDREDQHLHHKAQAKPKDEHVERGLERAGLRIQAREEVQTDRADRGADDGKDLVAPGPRDHLARADRGREQPGHERDELEAGSGRAEATDDLLEEGQVGECAEQCEPDDEADHARDHEDAVAKELERKNRLGGPMLDQDECCECQRGERPEADGERGVPCIGRAAEGGQQHQGREADAQQNGAQVVDAVLLAFADARQCDRENREGQGSQRDVDVEDPAPARVGGEEPADQRSRHAGHAEDGAEEPEVAAALTRRDDVPDRRLGADQQAPAAQALDCPKGDQLGHALCLSAESRTDQKKNQRSLQNDLAAVEIAELPVERSDDRDCEQVGRDDPGEVVETPEVADDRRQGGRDDRLVERRQQHRQHQRPYDDQDAASRWRLRDRGRSSHVPKRTERS